MRPSFLRMVLGSLSGASEHTFVTDVWETDVAYGERTGFGRTKEACLVLDAMESRKRVCAACFTPGRMNI